MTSVKAALATLQGAGFGYGIGEVRKDEESCVIRFSIGCALVDLPLVPNRRGEEFITSGPRLLHGVPVTLFDRPLSSETPKLVAIMGGSPTGVGLLAVRSAALRFEEFERLAGLSDSVDAPTFWPGGEGIGLPMLQVGERYHPDQHQLFVMREGQSVIVVDSQQRMGLVRFYDAEFSLRQLSQTDVFNHVIGRVINCRGIRELHWCRGVLRRIGMLEQVDVLNAKEQALLAE